LKELRCLKGWLVKIFITRFNHRENRTSTKIPFLSYIPHEHGGCLLDLVTIAFYSYAVSGFWTQSIFSWRLWCKESRLGQFLLRQYCFLCWVLMVVVRKLILTVPSAGPGLLPQAVDLRINAGILSVDTCRMTVVVLLLTLSSIKTKRLARSN
jgi:hypothetical protein